MKKRIFTVLLAVCLVFALGTVTALADESNFRLELTPWDSVVSVEENGQTDTIYMYANIFYKGSETALDEWADLDEDGYELDIDESYSFKYKEDSTGAYKDLPDGVEAFPDYGGKAYPYIDLSKDTSRVFKTGESYTIQVTGVITGTYITNDNPSGEKFTLSDSAEFTLTVVPKITSLKIEAYDFEVDYEQVNESKIFIPITVYNQDNFDVTGVCVVTAKIEDGPFTSWERVVLEDGKYAFGLFPLTNDILDDVTITFNAKYGEFEDTKAIKLTVSNPEAAAFAKITNGEKTTYYADLGDAINAAQDGDTIELLKDYVLGNANFSINQEITITGQKNITAFVSSGKNTIGFTILNGGKLTLDGVSMTIVGNDSPDASDGYDGTGIDVNYGGTLELVNGAYLYLHELNRGTISSSAGGATPGKFIVTGSSVMLQHIDGNASNGGTWTATNSAIIMDDIGNHALSVESIVADNSAISISDVGYCGIMAKNVTLNDNSQVHITESGKQLPFPSDSSSPSNWAPDGESYKRAVEIKKDGKLEVNSSELILENNKDANGDVIDTIYISKGSKLITSGNYSIVSDVANAVSETEYYTVKYLNDNSLYASIIVASNDNSYKLLPALTRNGYTFRGWKCNNQLYKAGETVKVSTDMTFTAVWDAIDIPDTYPIEVTDTANGSVDTSLSNASAGSVITITATPDTGYNVASVVVTGPDGRVDVTRVNATTYTFKMPEGGATVRVTFTNGLPFTDVKPGQWFYEAVSYVYTNGMMEGDSATTFNPDAQMTRAMFWAVLGRIDGADITGANWAAEAREWAMAEGVSDGTDANGLVTREQMVTMLWRYAGEPASDESLTGYSDAASVSSWAAEAMSWALENGIIEGMTATTLVPQGTATRAQCAAIFMRYDVM